MRCSILIFILLLSACTTVPKEDPFELAYKKYNEETTQLCGDISEYKEKGAVNINKCDFEFLIKLMKEINYPYIHYIELMKTQTLEKSLELDRGQIDLEEYKIAAENINAKMNVVIIEKMREASSAEKQRRSDALRDLSNSLNSIHTKPSTTTTNCVNTGNIINCHSY